jgi:hypothetical protein
MSATRLDALTQLAKGIAKFDGFTAGDFLAVNWSGVKGFASQDIEFFKRRLSQPVEKVAQECLSRTKGMV